MGYSKYDWKSPTIRCKRGQRTLEKKLLTGVIMIQIIIRPKHGLI
ncbi:hypothetical protein Gohar_006643 [Gossypium harknessii]|uniref:Uncharacterized protein n=1 Tax=Gossypium harknessii TaxID=34285 RepID=A0A7J9GE31_9ROSI|nr:hypothetical protein [Gossypium harknessii]